MSATRGAAGAALGACTLAYLFCAEPLQAACDFSPSPGNDDYRCDSGVAAALVDPQGNNSLVLPAGGSGTITGAVSFGAGADRIEVASGRIGGAVSQGDGIDSFRMSGGQIQSLSQGDGFDDFVMSGGTIVGAFEGGDAVSISGGSIGRVDIGLGANRFEMSGGRILANLVAGFDNDTLSISGGSVGGNVSLSSGNDRLSLSGGDIGGQVLMGAGNDALLWLGGGTFHGGLQMAAGDDSVSVTAVPAEAFAIPPSLDGGPGRDSLLLEALSATGGARYLNWESIELRNGARLDLDDSLVLGDSLSGQGQLRVDGGSFLTSASGRIRAFTSGQPAMLVNAGTIDLTRSGERTDDSLTVLGDYRGETGRLLLQAVLAGDGAPADRLIVGQGRLDGSTAIVLSNLGGSGGLTRGDGILLVEANQGASSSDQAFSLSQGLSVGAYQYYLFKGGLTAGTENSWYLRSSVAAPPPAPPEPPPPPLPPPPPEEPAPPPVPPEEPAPPAPPEEPPAAPEDPPVPPGQPTPPGPAPVTPPATPAPAVPAPNAPAPAAKAPIAAPGTPPLPRAAPGETIAIYRLEVPLYTAALPAAALLATSSLGSFHERQGDQRLLLGERALPASWGRWLGQSQRQAWAGAASPTFDGRLDGFQVGQDLFAHAGEGGLRQYAGFFVSHARLRGDVAGFALAFDDTDSGDLRLDGDSLGAYWTLLGAPGWYLDAVLMGSSFDGHARSARGLELPLQGHGYSLSLEAGYPLALDRRWAIEPQAQLIRQHLALDDSRDAVSTVDFEAGERWMARVGLRLRGDQEMAGMPLQSYLGVHFLQAFGEADGVVFADRQRLRTEQRGARVQVLAGLVLSPTPELGLYLTFGHADNLDSLDSRASQVSLGARLGW